MSQYSEYPLTSERSGRTSWDPSDTGRPSRLRQHNRNELPQLPRPMFRFRGKEKWNAAASPDKKKWPRSNKSASSVRRQPELSHAFIKFHSRSEAAFHLRAPQTANNTSQRRGAVPISSLLCGAGTIYRGAPLPSEVLEMPHLAA